MRYITIENLPPISKVGLGTIRFGERSFDPKEAEAIITRALELGVTHFDTAASYGSGRSEELLGRVLAANGATNVVVTSKVFPYIPTPAAIDRAARRSRERLEVPQIPLYLLHMPNPLTTRLIMRGFARAKASGIVGSIGVSNHSLAQWRKAEAITGQPVIANEILLNLLHRKGLNDTVSWAAQHHRLVIAAGPLAQGMLTGRYDIEHPPTGIHGWRRLGFRFAAFPPTKTNFRRFQPLLAELRSIAANHDTNPAAVALAWAISHDPVVVIPGASTLQQLEANVTAADITLNPGETEALQTAASELRSSKP
jgi:aryl-alcohol dehydrogenase-like predicted oxidoreductase